MYEILQSFWGGVLATISASLLIWSAWQAAKTHKRKIYFDIFSSFPILANIPEEVHVNFVHGGEAFDRVVSSYIIIKNETEAAISSDSILQEFAIQAPVKFELISQSIVETGESSGGQVVLNKKDNKLTLEDVIIPIEGALLIKVVSNFPISNTLLGVHKSHSIVRRDYRAFRFQWVTMVFISFLFIFSATAFIDLVFGIPDPIVKGLERSLFEIFGYDPPVMGVVLAMIASYFALALVFATVALRFFKLSKGEYKYRYLVSRDRFSFL